ncbi:MAG TPA: hypothetical protein VFS76_13080 [Pyrinomonadaceae bacterium]|nr:hypothetical protein [Pyrinomonadaceae bacterium]
MHSPSLLSVSLLALLVAGAGIAIVQRARRASPPQRTGSILRLDPNGAIQDAIDQAQPGDTIVLEAGAVYTGPITLPAKSGTDFITIQSSRVGDLPEGVRVSPSQSALLAKLQSATNSEPVVKTAPGAHHYRFVGIEFSTADANVKVYDLIRLGDWHSQTTLESVPHHLVIDRSYIHGFKTQEVQRGIALNSSETSITNSYISEVHGKGYDTQAICGWNGPGPFKIINNYLEAAGENVMFGGADPAIRELVPSDIEIRGNYFFKPLSWHPQDPSYAGIHWSVKNLFELKNARNVIIDGNIFENNWTDAQAGRAILFTVRNEQSTAPWSTIQNVEFTNNIVRNSPAALNLLGSDAPKPSTRATGLRIANNLFIDISAAFLTMSGYYDVVIEHNTHFQAGNIMVLYGEPSLRFTYKNNVTIRDGNGYGVKGDGTGEGTIALDMFTPGYKFEKNVIANANASLYPRQNFFPNSTSATGFVDYERGNYRLRPDSRYRGTATDGTDPGANFDKLPRLRFEDQ